MGNILQLVCEHCGASSEASIGCGMQAAVDTYYCPRCGHIDEQWSEVFGEEALQEPPRCRQHPDVAMLELTQASKVPCVACGASPVEVFEVGNWD